MPRRWAVTGMILASFAGCARDELRPEPTGVTPRVTRASFQPDETDPPPMPMAARAAASPAPTPEPAGPQAVDIYIRRALTENRTVQAAYHNVRSLRHRIPQVTALDDPILSNTIFPIPSVAPQYSLMGYNPYNATLAQQFPWFGTLRLRGEAADKDVQVALAELAAAQLDTVAAVKRAYFDLYVSQKTQDILGENRKVLEDFRTLARSRLATGGTQADALRSEVLISELDRELANTEQSAASARAMLARQIHVSPDADLRALPDAPVADVPVEVDRLYQLASAARPELRGRLAAIARDEKAVELARQRFYPNISLGITYMDMEKTNATTPKTAGGFPNVGLYVGFNLPVHQKKYKAGVCEAEERALADAKLYEAQRDETFSEIKDLMTQVRVQQNVLSLLRDSILPRSRDTFDLARSDYAKSNVDYATVLSSLRGVLQIELQIAQVEGELGKALASLERAVGCQINEHPPAPVNAPAISTTAPVSPVPPPPADGPGPFRPEPTPTPAPPALR